MVGIAFIPVLLGYILSFVIVKMYTKGTVFFLSIFPFFGVFEIDQNSESKLMFLLLALYVLEKPPKIFSIILGTSLFAPKLFK